MNCEICETAKAEIKKFEASYEYDENSHEIMTKVEVKICRECAETKYDGTEEFPKTYKL